MMFKPVGRADEAFQGMIDLNSANFKANIDFDSFEFKHSLVGNPLFDLPRLANLAKKIISLYDNTANYYVLSKIAESVPNVAKQWANFAPLDKVHESIRHIRESGSWVLITGAQGDPDYADLLEQLLFELEKACDLPLRSQISWACASILIGSPNSVTHYHMDSETNFLFQIHGRKEAHLFDQKDRAILSEQDIELFCVKGSEHIAFRDEFEAKSKVFDLSAGSGIHIPVNAPHWVKNLDDYSVTFSVLFYRREMDRRTRIYQANHIMRRLGLRPKPPGSAPLADGLKSGVIDLLATKSPRDKYDVLRSGYRRLTKPARLSKLWTKASS